MTTPLDPYASSTSNLPSATQGQIPGNIIGNVSNTVNTAQINVSSTGGGSILGYSSSPSVGNLYFSLSPSSTTDNFGNPVNVGLSVTAGQLTGMSLVGIQMDSTSTLQNTQINQPVVLNPTVAGGTAVSLSHTMTNAQGNVLGYTSGASAATFATNGVYSWTVPSAITVPTNIRVQCWAAGAGGGGGNGSEGGESGGGGEYAEEPAFTVQPGQVFTITVGQGGYGGSTGQPGADGGQTVFVTQNGGGNSVLANPGLAGLNFLAGFGGSGSVNTIHYNGGNGANASGFTGAAGGGGSGGTTGQGNAGAQSTSSSGAAGGAAVTGGGSGGTGGNSASNGAQGTGPGGAGGGAGADSTTSSSKTYNAYLGTYSYYGTDAMGFTPNSLHDHDGTMFQGQPANNSAQGYQYSFINLNSTQIRADLAGVNVTSVSLKIHNTWTYYSGAYCQVSYTNIGGNNAFGNIYSGPVPGTAVKNFWVNENATITENMGLGGGIGVALQNGNCQSIMLGPGAISPWQDYHATWDSGANNGVKPALIVYYNVGGNASAGAGNDGQVILTFANTGAPTFQLSVSATTTTDVFGNPLQQGFTGPQLTLTAQTTPTTVNSSSVLAANTSSTAVNVVSSNGFTGTMLATQADITTFTVSSSSYTQMTKAYTLPAGDPQLGTTYRLTAFGNITVGNAAPQWNAALVAYGTTMASYTWGGASWDPNLTYDWVLTGILQIVALTGPGAGTMRTYLTGTLGAQAGVNLGNTSYGGALTGIGAVANFTDVSTTMQLQTKLQTETTVSTLFCYGSILERLGP